MGGNLSDALVAVAAGDVLALRVIRLANPRRVADAADSLDAQLTVTPRSVTHVLRLLLGGVCRAMEAQEWASFVRRGYVGRPGGGPVRPIDIAFSSEDEDFIAEAISRLDELGDKVDGEMSVAEIEDLIDALEARRRP